MSNVKDAVKIIKNGDLANGKNIFYFQKIAQKILDRAVHKILCISTKNDLSWSVFFYFINGRRYKMLSFKGTSI